MKQESWEQARQAFRIESECIGKMEAYLNPESFGAAVRLLAQAERIANLRLRSFRNRLYAFFPFAVLY